MLHGEDEFSRSEALARLKARMGDPAMADLNTVVLDGRKLSLEELIRTCDTVPFLGERRLVIVEGLLTRLTPQEGKAGDKGDYLTGLMDYLPRLPPTTRLIFLEPRSLPPDHPFLQWACQTEDAYIKEFKPPRERDLPSWIKKRARKKGGEIEAKAADELARFVGNDLRLLDQEIEKLIAYAGARPITLKDVRLLVSYTREARIFDLVDAIGEGRRQRALELLYRLFEEGASPLYVLAMIARQFRIMMEVKELSKGGLSAGEMASRLQLHRFTVEKGLRQARTFSERQLESAYRRILETDLAIKTGRMGGVLALEMLVIGLT